MNFTWTFGLLDWIGILCLSVSLSLSLSLCLSLSLTVCLTVFWREIHKQFFFVFQWKSSITIPISTIVNKSAHCFYWTWHSQTIKTKSPLQCFLHSKDLIVVCNILYISFSTTSLKIKYSKHARYWYELYQCKQINLCLVFQCFIVLPIYILTSQFLNSQLFLFEKKFPF